MNKYQPSIPEIIAISIKRYLHSPEDEIFFREFRQLREPDPSLILELIDEYFDRKRLQTGPLIEGDRLLYNYLKEFEGFDTVEFPETDSIINYESQIRKLKAEIEELKKVNEDLRQTQDSFYIRDYKLIRQIAGGGYGTVFEVEHLLSGEHFAIKRLHSEDETEQDNILREIKALAPLNHSNVIGYKNSFQFKKHLYLVMEYCPDGSLGDRLKKSGKLSEDELIKTFLTLTKAFMALHKEGIIHHDIKPSNLLYSRSGEIKISDFGAVNTSIGTPIYYPPELFMSKEYISDPRTDVFSLGITLLECALGYHPLIQLNFEDRIARLKSADLPVGQFPFWLQQTVLKAVNFDPDQRFQSMEEFHEALIKKDVPMVLSTQLIKKEKEARALRTHLKLKKWERAGKLIKRIPEIPQTENNLNLLIEAGKYYLQVHDLKNSRISFERAQKINPNASIEKQLAEVYIQIGECSKAANILQGYINRNFLDLEAHNQLLHTYFLSQRWELGLDQSEIMLKIAPGEEVFKANRILFEILCGRVFFDEEPSALPVFARYNLSVLQNNDPVSCSFSYPPFIHDKLLFQEFRFRNIEKERNAIEFWLPGEIVRTEQSIISFGRQSYDYNDYSLFPGTSVSRRHFVIINMKNNVWLYDLESTSGVYNNGRKVNNKCFLLGLSEIRFGDYLIKIKSDAGLLF